MLTKASNFYSGSGQPDFVRFSALRLAPHLRHVYVLTLSCVSEIITVLGLSSVSQLGIWLTWHSFVTRNIYYFEERESDR